MMTMPHITTTILHNTVNEYTLEIVREDQTTLAMGAISYPPRHGIQIATSLVLSIQPEDLNEDSLAFASLSIAEAQALRARLNAGELAAQTIGDVALSVDEVQILRDHLNNPEVDRVFNQ